MYPHKASNKGTRSKAHRKWRRQFNGILQRAVEHQLINPEKRPEKPRKRIRRGLNNHGLKRKELGTLSDNWPKSNEQRM